MSLSPGLPETLEADIDREQLMVALRYDCISFLAFYIGESLTLDVPELHIDIWNQLLEMVEAANNPGVIQSLRKLFAVPREHAKSTLAKLAVILILKYTPLSFVLYTSKTNTIAKNAIRDIIGWLQLPQERTLFGPLQTIKSSETESLWIFQMAIRRTATSPIVWKKIIFKALGADQQVRGMLIDNRRPEIIVIDDIEDLDNTKTLELQAGLDEWFLGSFLKSFAKTNIVIFIGNMIRKTSLLARLAKDPSWQPTVYGSLVRSKLTHMPEPLWPGRWTVEALLKEYAEYRRLGRGYVWEAEMMNLTQDEILQMNLDKAVRPPRPEPMMLESGCLTLDPAFSKESIGDESSITVHARIKGVPIPCVIDQRSGRWSEDELFTEMLDLSYFWGLTTWLIEADAGQRLLIPYFTLLMQTRKITQGLFVMLPVYSGGVNKASRIITFRNSIGNGSYGLCESEDDLMIRLLEYKPESKTHDDRCDSAAYGPIAWVHYNETIELAGIKQVAMLAHGDGNYTEVRVQQEWEVAGF